MAPQSIQPRPCTGSARRGQDATDDRIALAESLCGGRGARLTLHRRHILELLWEHGRPMGAYELIEALRHREARPIGPPTVYRALGFLMAQGLVSKIESSNAYVPCANPAQRHDCMFFVCSSCGASAELEDPRVERLLAEDADVLGFRLSRRIVEVQGMCRQCVEAGAA